MYAHYNDIYKKLLYLARQLDAPEPGVIFESQGYQVSSSQLQAWRVGRSHKKFRPIDGDYVIAFAEGLIQHVKNGGADRE